MRENELKKVTDGRLLLFVGTEYAEHTPFTVIVAHNGHEIIDELVYPSDFGALYTMRKINELIDIYGKFAPTAELQTNDTELMRLAANAAGIHLRPKRRKDVTALTKRTFDLYAAGDFLYEIYDHIKPVKERSKLRTWLIKGLQKALRKLEGES